MKTIVVLLMLAGAALAEQCEVTGMETRSFVDSSPYYTQDYGHGVKVTTGGPGESKTRVYTVRMGKTVYKLSPKLRWTPRLTIGAIDCRLKKNDVIIDGFKYSIEGEEAYLPESR
jgi:hypothetical protein